MHGRDELGRRLDDHVGPLRQKSRGIPIELMPRVRRRAFARHELSDGKRSGAVCAVRRVVGLGAARPACQGQCLIASSPISAWSTCPPTGRTFDHRCCGRPRSALCTGATSLPQAMTNAVMQGDEWAAYRTLGRTTATYRGMAYSARRLGSRSPDSSRGSHAPPGRTGKLSAGRSGIP